MAAPIRKVAPNAQIVPPNVFDTGTPPAPGAAAAGPSIHDSLSSFGVVVSSTAPGALHRASSARAQIRRVIAVR